MKLKLTLCLLFSLLAKFEMNAMESQENRYPMVIVPVIVLPQEVNFLNGAKNDGSVYGGNDSPRNEELDYIEDLAEQLDVNSLQGALAQIYLLSREACQSCSSEEREHAAFDECSHSTIHEWFTIGIRVE